MKRRSAIKTSIMGTAGLMVGKKAFSAQNHVASSSPTKIKHSACRWCYQGMPLDALAEAGKDIGLSSIELLNPSEWDTVLRYGLTCGVSNGSSLGITKGFNDPLLHNQLRLEYKTLLPMAADKGIQQIICFSGNRNGMSDELGLENCAIGLDPIVKEAEKYGIKIIMELLNSKVDHKDYMCDHTAWGAQLTEKLGSTSFGLLYDIYHMQIMEGDVIRTIRDFNPYIAHYHTGGVPGRNEINKSQELNYSAIIQAISDTGFDGFVAQEFIPTRQDPMVSLKEGVDICSI